MKTRGRSAGVFGHRMLALLLVALMVALGTQGDGSLVFAFGETQENRPLVFEPASPGSLSTYASNIDTGWYNTADDSFVIGDGEQLAGLAAIVNGTAEGIDRDSFADKTVTLGEDIFLDGSLDWVPIGLIPLNGSVNLPNSEAARAFQGTLDGGGHRISNLTISDADSSGAALFGFVGASGTVRDLAVDGSVSGAYYVAGVAAFCSGTIERVINDVAINANYDVLGGIVAEGLPGFSVTDCRNQGPISNDSWTRSSGRLGGIVGRAEGVGYIARCANIAELNGYQYVGGIIGGQFGNVTVEYCYNAANLTSRSFGKVYLGGIAGKSEGGSISNCYNTGNLYDAHWAEGHIRAVGGIAGCEEGREGGFVAISNCYTTGFIELYTANMGGTNQIYEVGNISGGNSSTGQNTMHYTDCFYLAERIAVASPTHPDYRLWAQVYKENPLIWDTPYIAPVSFGELADPAFIERIGSAFVADESEANGGFPLLYWQMGDTLPSPSFAVGIEAWPAENAVAVSLAGEIDAAGRAEQNAQVEVSIDPSLSTQGSDPYRISVTDAAGNAVAVTYADSADRSSASFTMPPRSVTLQVLFGSAIPGAGPGPALHSISWPADLDAIWAAPAIMTHPATPESAIPGQALEGATVFVEAVKDANAATTSLTGLTASCGGEPIAVSRVGAIAEKNGAGYRALFGFTMPAGDVQIAPEAGYTRLAVYEASGDAETVSPGEPIASYSRADMLALATPNLYYSGYSSDTEGFIGKAEQGVTLGDLLGASGVGFSAGDTLRLISVDGLISTFTYEQLYQNQRYYYPNLITGADAAAKAAGRTPVDALLVIKGNIAEGAADIEEATCDTLNTYRFVFGQTETDFNGGVPSVAGKVNDKMPKYVDSVAVIHPLETFTGVPSFGVWVVDPDGGDPLRLGNWVYDYSQGTYVDPVSGEEPFFIEDYASEPLRFSGVDHFYAARLGVVTRGIPAYRIIDWYNESKLESLPEIDGGSYREFSLSLSANSSGNDAPDHANSSTNPGNWYWVGWDDRLTGTVRYYYPGFLLGESNWPSNEAGFRQKPLGEGEPVDATLGVSSYNERITRLPADGSVPGLEDGRLDNVQELEAAFAFLTTRADSNRALRAYAGQLPDNSTMPLGTDPYNVGSVWITLPSDGVPSDFFAGSGWQPDTAWYNPAQTDFTITTADQLAGLASIVNGTAPGIAQDDFAEKTVVLGASIRLAPDGLYQSGSGTFGSPSYPMQATYYTRGDDAPVWTPIGSGTASGNDSLAQANWFAGTFDGAGYSISGLYTDGTLTVQGLFGCVSGTVRDVHIASGLVSAHSVVGAVAAYLDGGTIEGCTNAAVVYADGATTVDSGLENGALQAGAVGGIVGSAAGSAAAPFTVAGCANSGTIVCTNTNKGGRIGGIVGLIDKTSYFGAVTACANSGDINGWQYVGGIVGSDFSPNAPISACVNTGGIRVNASGSAYGGGIVSHSYSDVRDCYNTGVYTGALWRLDKSAHLAGIVSDIYAPGIVSNCYNTGHLELMGTSVLSSSVGRIVGYGGNGRVQNCYFLNIDSDLMEFADADASLGGQGWLPLSAGLSAEEMRSAGFVTALGAAFRADDAGSNDGFPVLAWQADSGGDGDGEQVGAPGSGDFNGDTFTTLDEALLLVQIINTDSFGSLSAGQFAAMDINADGYLTMADVLLVVQIILRS